MPNDFLTSLHSQVMPVFEEKPGTKPVEKPSITRRRGRTAVPDDDKHRTIGVSMPPGLRERAGERAAAVGLSFSRYVQWCIEAELDGASLESRFQKPAGR